MPITQSRMMRLLSVTDHCISTFDKFSLDFRQIAESQSTFDGPLAQARKELTALPPEVLANEHLRAAFRHVEDARQALIDFFDTEFRIPLAMRDAFIEEKTHFRINANRNTHSREANRRRRQAQYDRREEERATIYRYNFAEDVSAPSHSSSQPHSSSEFVESVLSPRVAAQLEADMIEVDGIKASPAWHAARQRQLKAEAAPQPDAEAITSPEPDGRAAYERDRAARRAAEVEADEELAATIARGERPRLIADEE